MSFVVCLGVLNYSGALGDKKYEKFVIWDDAVGEVKTLDHAILMLYYKNVTISGLYSSCVNYWDEQARVTKRVVVMLPDETAFMIHIGQSLLNPYYMPTEDTIVFSMKGKEDGKPVTYMSRRNRGWAHCPSQNHIEPLQSSYNKLLLEAKKAHNSRMKTAPTPVERLLCVKITGINVSAPTLDDMKFIIVNLLTKEEHKYSYKTMQKMLRKQQVIGLLMYEGSDIIELDSTFYKTKKQKNGLLARHLSYKWISDNTILIVGGNCVRIYVNGFEMTASYSQQALIEQAKRDGLFEDKGEMSENVFY